MHRCASKRQQPWHTTIMHRSRATTRPRRRRSSGNLRRHQGRPIPERPPPLCCTDQSAPEVHISNTNRGLGVQQMRGVHIDMHCATRTRPPTARLFPKLFPSSHLPVLYPRMLTVHSRLCRRERGGRGGRGGRMGRGGAAAPTVRGIVTVQFVRSESLSGALLARLQLQLHSPLDSP